jgi:FSR family fosmidomycin resistance protein-like MFS transporter
MTATAANPTNAHATPLRQDAAVIGLVGLAHASSHFSHLLLPLMFPVFMKVFSLTYSELGLLMSIFFVVSGIGQALAGFLVDRLGARSVLFAALSLLAMGCLWAARAQGYTDLMVVAVFLGLGNCSFHPVDFTILNQRVSVPRLGYAFSAHGLTGNLGWAVAPVFMVGLSEWWDWRVAYQCAAFFFLSILALALWQRDALSTQVHSADHGAAQQASALAFMKVPVVWWCFAFFMLSTMTLAIVQTFGVSILQKMHGVSFAAANMTLTAYMLCAAAGMFVGGFVAARWPVQSDRVVAVCMTAGAGLFALCGTGLLNGMGTMVALAVTGLAIGVGGPSRDMMIKKATPPGATGRVYGMVYSGLDVGFALSPVIFGGFMDRGWYGATLVGGALVLLFSVLAALGIGKRTVARH